MVRKLWLAAAVIVGLAGASPAEAQRVWQDGRWVVMPQRSKPTVMPVTRDRWGPQIDGRWNAGYRAPGGWSAYRRLNRGGHLPSYWMSQDYRVPDYLSFGLAAPPRGYYWVRYYDDAVLVDERGSVWDSIDGISWGDAVTSSAGWSGGYASATAKAGAPYPPPGRIEPVDPNAYYDQRYDDPIPAPRVERRHDRPAPPVIYAPPAPIVAAPPSRPPVVVQSYPAQGGAYYDGTFYGGGSSYQASSAATYYAAGGYGGTTTVIINPAPVTTTTVIEETVVEERVVTSYVKKPVRKLVRKPRARPSCCACICR